ncbi:MAG: thiamine-phosphate kinase [Proteobacteria bacterium]|nr:thiamine-phosphate kinase [Pseudomonadota bacterium]
MDEFALIRRFFDRPVKDDSVRLGIGDDGAVIVPDPGRELISVVDTIVAGVHYPLDLPPFDVGYRAVAINLSDVAAMGGRPRWMTLALSIPQADTGWLSLFAEGLFTAAAEAKVSLVGGDTTRSETTVVSVQMLGDIDPHDVIKRSGAGPGDSIFVTGTPGDAAAGLSLLKSGSDQTGESEYLIGRFVRPRVRLAFASSITRLASAAIDLSDGLYADLQKLLMASKAGAKLELAQLPFSAEILAKFDYDAVINFALAGGDDYELCFTVPRSKDAEIHAVAKQNQVQVTRIGRVVSGDGIECTKDGVPFEYADTGYRHF